MPTDLMITGGSIVADEPTAQPIDDDVEVVEALRVGLSTDPRVGRGVVGLSTTGAGAAIGLSKQRSAE